MLHLLHRCQAASRTPSVLQFLNKDHEYLNLLYSYSATKLPFFPCLWQATRCSKLTFNNLVKQLEGELVVPPWAIPYSFVPRTSQRSAKSRDDQPLHWIEKKESLQMMMICKRYFTQCWPPTFTEALSFVAGAGVKPTYEWRTEIFGDSIEKSKVTQAVMDRLMAD